MLSVVDLNPKLEPNRIKRPFVPALALLLALAAAAAAPAASAASQQQYFEAQPEAQQLVPLGQGARLRCLVRNRQGECAWLRNGRVLAPIARKYQFARAPEDGDCSLSISNASVALDDGRWQCQVLSQDIEQDALQTRDVNLIVLVPPEKPQIKNLSAGAAKLMIEEAKQKIVTCEIRGGNPAPQIEWFLDGKNVTKESTQSITGTGPARLVQSRLRLDNIRRSMNGKNLTCLGLHQTQNQSNSVELDVQYVPTVSLVQREYSIVEGSPLSISCQVDANPPPSLVNWRLVNDGSQTQRSRAVDREAIVSNKVGPVLEFHSVGREYNQNVFECLAQNAQGISTPVDVRLNVLYAPFLLNTSHSESVGVGSDAHLACIFDGNPAPEINWFYMDPLSRTAKAMQVDRSQVASEPSGQGAQASASPSQQQLFTSAPGARAGGSSARPLHQTLTIKNVTYRNEGDYFCEARSSINGHSNVVHSSNIQLDVYGEPQFLARSPQSAKAVQGSKSEIALTFCADPPPLRVYWQFGSINLEVSTNSPSGRQASQATATPPSGAASKLPASLQRFRAQPLQPLQRRESSFSKLPTCFEAQLSLLEPELSDARDYVLHVSNERGSSSGLVRLRVSTPLSPALMISSAFVFICALFLLSLFFLFILKKRQCLLARNSPAAQQQQQLNGAAHQLAKSNSHRSAASRGRADLLKGLASAAVAANGKSNGLLQMAPDGQQAQAATKGGVVSGFGAGLANGASNPLADHRQAAPLDHDGEQSTGGKLAPANGLMSMASSDTSCNDQRQLLATSSSSSGQNSSSVASSTSGSAQQTPGAARKQQLQLEQAFERRASGSTDRSSASSSPRSSTPMNHISVDEELQLNGSYQPTDSAARGARLSPAGPAAQAPLIYANIDYSANAGSTTQRQRNLSLSDAELDDNLLAANSLLGHSKVSATIALMNGLAAGASNTSPRASGESGALSDAINQQLSAARGQQQAQAQALRRPGPPKPPKPSIQLRSRFYQQVQQANGAAPGPSQLLTGELELAGGAADPLRRPLQHSPVVNQSSSPTSNGHRKFQSSATDELADEYSRFSFPARAEL